MVPITNNNKHLLKQLLTKKLETFLEKVDDGLYNHNFTKENPFLKIDLTITADEFEVVFLRMKNEELTKKIERLDKKHPILELKEFPRIAPHNDFN